MLASEIDRRGWYNFPLFIEFTVKMDELFGSGDLTLNQEMARWSCHLSTPKLYSVFIRLGSVDWVLKRAAKLWCEHFNAGSFEILTDKASDYAEAEIVDFPTPHLAHTYAVLGFAMGCVELSGMKNVRGRLVTGRSLGGERSILRVDWGEEE